MIEIGEDLVDEILVRQPAKSLMRFNCVCKRWNDLFRKPTFANRNMKLHDKKKYVLTREVYAPPLFMISENDGEVLELQHPTPDDDNPAWIMEMHVYNGVLLFRSIASGKLFFWNPITREIKYITPPPFHKASLLSTEGVKIINGFGGDPDTIDFKHFSAVSIVEPTHEAFHFGKIANVTYPHISFQLYSLSTDSWTPLDLVLPVTFDSVLGWSADLFFNGVLHWLYNEGGDESEKGILCFHFSNNQFTTLPLPPYNTTLDFPPNPFNLNMSETLHEINDSLAYVQHRDHYTPLNDLGHVSVHSFINIWTLDKDTCCWTKKYKFEPLTDLHGSIIGFWKDTPELFGSYISSVHSEYGIRLHLGLYHPDGHLIHHFEQIPLTDRTRPTLIHKYVQSIAPLSFS